MCNIHDVCMESNRRDRSTRSVHLDRVSDRTPPVQDVYFWIFRHRICAEIMNTEEKVMMKTSLANPCYEVDRNILERAIMRMSGASETDKPLFTWQAIESDYSTGYARLNLSKVSVPCETGIELVAYRENDWEDHGRDVNCSAWLARLDAELGMLSVRLEKKSIPYRLGVLSVTDPASIEDVTSGGRPTSGKYLLVYW